MQAMSVLGKDLLTDASLVRIEQLKDQLEIAMRTKRTSFAYSIEESFPIETIESEGAFAGMGTHRFVASISWIWEVGLDVSGKCRINGNASTMVWLLDLAQADLPEIARWRVDVGDSDGPGCCVHLQMGHVDGDIGFPSSLPVPRFHALTPTPMMAIELVLSEFFHDTWEQRIAGSTPECNMWRGVQKRRLKSFLEWQIRTASEAGDSPLVSLKRFPPSDIFVG
jgi:hypothetical protein